jgi:predicted adenine nucleotide alpha hydrolase (AANH) superfamily ATPase
MAPTPLWSMVTKGSEARMWRCRYTGCIYRDRDRETKRGRGKRVRE